VSPQVARYADTASCLRYGRQTWWRRFLWLLTAFLALYHISAVIQFLLADRFFDFAHYYLYARNLIEGRSLFDLEAPRVLADQLQIRYADAPPNYPPPFYLIMSLLAVLPYHLASIVWLLLNELFLLAALIWRGAGKLKHNPARLALLGVVALAFQPLYETLALGQTNVLVLAGVTLMVRLWASGSMWSGVVLGLMVMVKPQVALLAVLWLRSTEWRHLGAAAGTVCAIIVGSLPLVGQDTWVSYLGYLRDFPCAVSLWALNLSLRGFLFRLQGGCQADGFGDPMAVVSAVGGGVVVGLLVHHLWKSPPADPAAHFRVASLVLCVIYLVSPYTQEHHLTVLLMAFARLAIDSGLSEGSGHRIGWVAAYVLIATAYSLVRFPAFHLGLPSVLLFGKGLGVILLGIVLASGPDRRQKVAPSFLPPLLVSVGVARATHAALKVMVMGELDAVLLSESILAAGLLLSWAVMVRTRLVKVTA